MAYGTYGVYGTAGNVPSAPNPVVPANPIHERPDAFRPDFMPLHDTSGVSGTDPSMHLDWDDYAPAWPQPLSPYEVTEAMYGEVTRDRDKTPNAGRPVNASGAELNREHHADEFYDAGVQGPFVNNMSAPYYYDDLDVPGGFEVDRRTGDIEPTERAFAQGGNKVPGANSLPMNNIAYDRWRHDELIPIQDFGEPIQPGTDVIVTVDRRMVQPYGGNLVEGLKMYPHPMGDNLLQAPMAPSQFPDRPMEVVDPYLPGDGGLTGRGRYRDTSRRVYSDPAIDVQQQAFAEPIPAGAASYDNSWE